MKRRILAASFAAVLVIASGVAGSFFLAGAQEQGLSSGSPQISLDRSSLELGSPIAVNGNGFSAESDISLYVMSASEASLTGSNVTLLQEIGSASASDSGTDNGSNLVSDAFDALRDLLDMQDEPSTDNKSVTGRLLVVSDREFDNETVTLECDDQEIAREDVSDQGALLSLPVAAGEYAECNITVSDENGVVDSAQLGRFTISLDSDEEYEESLAGTARSDSSGAFSAEVTIAQVSAEQFAILAVANEGQQAAVSEAFSIQQNTSAAEDQPVDDISNQTDETAAPFVQDNVTSTQENETASTTNQTGDARVELDEEQVEAGSPLAIQGDGFEPNTPVQVFINSVQITNVITNVQGSFNTVVIVPTTVSNGEAEVEVRTERTNVVTNVGIVEEDAQNQGPSWIRFNAILADDSERRLEGAPVTIFDTRTGKLVESDRTPFVVELDKGKYSVFYSDFRNFRFESAEPGRWIDTPGGGSGLLTVREGRNATITATYDEEPAPPPVTPATSTLVLRAQDTDGNTLEGMFVSVYDAETGDTIEQGFTELRIEELSAGTYPIFFANFGQMSFVSGSPGSWVQTPYGGAGLVVIPDDGTSREVVVTATYDSVTTVVEVEPNIQAPIDIRGHVFTITSNETRPEGPFVISGTMALRVESEEPLATLTAYLMSVREDSNENVDLESQRSRDHDTFQIVDLKPENAAPTGPNSYIVTGTADLLLNGEMYSNDEEIQVVIRGGEDLTPTNVEIEFQGEHRYSGANRLETLYAVVTDGFQ